MRKTRYRMSAVVSAALIGWLALPAPLCAQDAVTLLFYYPGGENTTDAARTVMGLFADAVNQTSGVKIAAEYYPNRNPFAQLVGSSPHPLILMRLDSYLEFSREGVDLIPQLLAEPAFGSGSTTYRIYGGKDERRCARLYLGVDLSSAFMGQLFGKDWQSIPMALTQEPLEALEALAAQNQAMPSAPEKAQAGACVVLDARQWEALESIQFPWEEDLKKIAESIPTANPMVVSVGKPSAAGDKVLAALSMLDDKSEYGEILTELQVKQFLPLSADQATVLADWKTRYGETPRAPR